VCRNERGAQQGKRYASRKEVGRNEGGVLPQKRYAATKEVHCNERGMVGHKRRCIVGNEGINREKSTNPVVGRVFSFLLVFF